MLLFATLIQKKKGHAIITWVMFRLITAVVFNRKNLPERIEDLDDSLTNHCTRERRNQWIRAVNFLVNPRWIRRKIETRLNKNSPIHEHVLLSLDTELSYSKIYKKDFPFRQRWSNWYGNHISEPLKVFVPGSGSHTEFENLSARWLDYDFEGLREVQAIVSTAEQEGRQIRAIGSGHALTPIAQCEDFIICTQNLNLTQRRATQFIKPAFKEGFDVEVNYQNQKSIEKHYLFETSGGTKVHELITALEREGLALMNKGGSSIQAISGAIATSTHGSGIGIGPLPSMVKSMTIVGTKGKVYRIEPTDGITDKEAFLADPATKVHGIELIQDDDTFHAVMVGVGSMGFVFSLIIEVQESYRLYEERKVWVWEEFKVKMQEGDLYSFINSHRHFEVLINPYIDEGEEMPARKCLVTTRNYTHSSKVPPNAQRERNYLSSFVSGISISGRLSSWVFNRNAENIPRLTNNSLIRLEDYASNGGGFEDIYNKVLDQGLGELKFYGYAIEMGFEIEKAFEAVDLITKICKEAMEYGHYLAAPFSLRYVKQCPGYFSMMNQRDTCMIEVVSVKNVTGTISLLKRIEAELIAIGGNPHWGLSLLPWSKEMVTEAFPHYEDWKKHQQVFGGDTFINPFIKNFLD
nr:FAD-binding protein [Cytophagales bacterium]